MINLLDTIRNTLVPIHKEGYVFVLAFFVASLLLGLIAAPAVLDRPRADAVVRLFLPRSGARDPAG